jgi:hypothetical protein
MTQRALDGLLAYGQGQYGQQFRDVYDARAQQAGVDLQRAAVQANNQSLASMQDAQNQMAMQGGNQMLTGQQNANNLSNTQRGMALGYANQMFGGLNNLLSGLFS